MANLQKYTVLQLGHLFKHYAREKDENGNFIKFGNQSIDTSKTHLNYNLCDRNMSQYNFLKQRKSEVKCLNRKDVNVMCSWVITLPKSFPTDREKEFFEQSYEFLKNRYGEKNVISSYVYLDEKQPHMHFSFLPVVIDKKKNIEKISAKKLITKNELKIFHRELKNQLDKYFNFEVEILNGATKDGNKSIKELKEIDEVIKQKQKELDKIKSDIKKLTTGKYLNESAINQLKNSTSLFGFRKIEDKVFNNLLSEVLNTYNIRNINNDLRKNNKILDTQNKKLSEKIGSLQDKNQKLNSEIRQLKKDYKFINFIPQSDIDCAKNKLKENEEETKQFLRENLSWEEIKRNARIELEKENKKTEINKPKKK